MLVTIDTCPATAPVSGGSEGGQRGYLGGLGTVERAEFDGGGPGKLGGGGVLAGDVGFVGGELRSFLGRAPTPAGLLRCFCAWNREGMSAGGCGGNGGVGKGQRREKGEAS